VVVANRMGQILGFEGIEKVLEVVRFRSLKDGKLRSEKAYSFLGLN
jgi:hypothetical protein